MYLICSTYPMCHVWTQKLTSMRLLLIQIILQVSNFVIFMMIWCTLEGDIYRNKNELLYDWPHAIVVHNWTGQQMCKLVPSPCFINQFYYTWMCIYTKLYIVCWLQYNVSCELLLVDNVVYVGCSSWETTCGHAWHEE